MPAPPGLSNKVLWLRAKDLTGAAGSTVSSWTDQSGTTHNPTFTTNTGTNRGVSTVATASTPGGGKSLRVDYAGISLPDLGLSTDGEMWIVVKSDGGADSVAGAWKFGTDTTSNIVNYYPYSGVVYDDFGNGTRRQFTPTLAVTSWRLYRVSITAAGAWLAQLDNVTQLSLTGVTPSFARTGVVSSAFPHLSRRDPGNDQGGFKGNIAEVLVRSAVSTPAEVADLITYFNTEHGLTVAGGSNAAVESAALEVLYTPEVQTVQVEAVAAEYLHTLTDPTAQVEAVAAEYLSVSTTNPTAQVEAVTAEYLFVPTAETPQGWGLQMGVVDTYRDNFNRTDAAVLGSTLDPASKAWSAPDWGIVSNRAKVRAGVGDSVHLAAIDTRAADVTVSVTLGSITLNTDYYGVAARCDNAGNGYFVQINGPTQQISIIRMTAGVSVTVGSLVSFVPTVGDVLTFEVNGPSLVTKINGVVKSSVTDSTHRYGTVQGMWAYVAASQTGFDDFSVTPINQGSSYARTVLADAPLAYYRLNATTGTIIADSSGNYRTMNSVSAVPTWGAAQLAYGGADSAASMTIAAQAMSRTPESWMWVSGRSYTIEAWIKTSSTGVILSMMNVAAAEGSVARNFIFAVNDSASYGGTTGKLLMRLSRSAGAVTFESTALVNDNAVHHVAVVVDETADTVTFYIDGVASGSGSIAGMTLTGGINPSGSTNPLVIGAAINAGNINFTPYNGTLDEVALYGTALSAARIGAHYTAGQDAAVSSWTAPSTGFRPLTYSENVLVDAPSMHLRMDEGSGTTAVDATGNARNATLTGGATLAAMGLVGTGALDVNSGYATVPYGAWMATAAFTYEAVIYSTSTSTGAWQAIIDRDYQSARCFQFAVLGNGTLMFTQTSAGAQFGVQITSAAGAVPINARAHVAVTYDAGALKLYSNGVQVASATGLTISGASLIAIGRSYGGSPTTPAFNQFIGRIDEVAFYPAALSAARIAAHAAVVG